MKTEEVSEQKKADIEKVNLSFLNSASLFALAFTHRSKIYVAEGMSKATIKKRQHWIVIH